MRSMRYEFCELSRWVSVWVGIPAGRQLGWDMEETQVHDTVTYLQVNIHVHVHVHVHVVPIRSST